MAEVCASCKAPLVWALTPQGSRTPIDREPGETGGTAPNTLLLSPTGFGPLAVVLSKGGLEYAKGKGVALRTNHWATCPDKDEWRERTDAKRREPDGPAPD